MSGILELTSQALTQLRTTAPSIEEYPRLDSLSSECSDGVMKSWRERIVSLMQGTKA